MADKTSAPKRKPVKKMAILMLVAIGVLAAFLYWWNSRSYESTDNAFIDGNIMQISSQVPGQVLKVHVRDNQHVKRGDLLVELDPRDYEARLAEATSRLSEAVSRQNGTKSNLRLTSAVTDAVVIQAESALAAARAQLEVFQARLNQDEDNIRAAEANLRQADARKDASNAEMQRAAMDVERYRALYKKDEISKQALDRAETEARATAANFEAASQAALAAAAQHAQARSAQAATLANISQAEALVRQSEGRLREAQSAPHQVEIRRADVDASHAKLKQLEAIVRQAELSLSYTRISAPDDGYVARKSVEPGNYVQVGQALMAVVSERLWVVANFKETQLRHMRPEQPVEITVDAYPQRKFNGKIDSIQSGSGARFSLMPPENATGNYVKVVQRVPVKILFTDTLPVEYKIGPGMSVVPKVKIR
jgi:membrane fusion protein (multidrug efflux system)